MTHYSLLFGRVARVAVSGRALPTEEDGEFWVEGVNPGGLAATGKSPASSVSFS